MTQQFPYGTPDIAERVLDDFYRQLIAAKMREVDALARLRSLNNDDPKYWDLIDEAAEEVDAARNEIAAIEREIAWLEAELRRRTGGAA